MNKIKTAIKGNIIFRTLFLPLIYIKRLLRRRKEVCQKQVIQNLGDVLVDDPVIKADEFNGVFAIGVRSDLFFRIVAEKRYEPALVRLCLKYLNRERDVIDVGANIGLFTVLFAKNIGDKKVLSIEPTKNALQRLKKNIIINDISRKVIVFEGIVSDQEGVQEIHIIQGMEEFSSIGTMSHPSIRDRDYVSAAVQGTTLDSLVKQRNLDPGFIKVDVEGAEHLVFKGAQEILSRKRPVILSELSDYLLKKNGSSAGEVIRYIASFDYDVHYTEESMHSEGFGEIVCFPKEMKAVSYLDSLS